MFQRSQTSKQDKMSLTDCPVSEEANNMARRLRKGSDKFSGLSFPSRECRFPLRLTEDSLCAKRYVVPSKPTVVTPSDNIIYIYIFSLIKTRNARNPNGQPIRCSDVSGGEHNFRPERCTGASPVRRQKRVANNITHVRHLPRANCSRL
jgi:hypothetical protein